MTTVIGPLTLVADEDALVAVHFGDEGSATLPYGAVRGESPPFVRDQLLERGD